MDDCTLFTCSEFWKDVKRLGKHIKPSFLEVELSPEEFEKLSVSDKISAVPIIRQIANSIKNKIGNLNELPNNDKNGQQPFLSQNWVIYKMRWGVDNHGPSYGLRVMYSVMVDILFLLPLNIKKILRIVRLSFNRKPLNV